MLIISQSRDWTFDLFGEWFLEKKTEGCRWFLIDHVDEDRRIFAHSMTLEVQNSRLIIVRNYI